MAKKAVDFSSKYHKKRGFSTDFSEKKNGFFCRKIVKYY